MPTETNPISTESRAPKSSRVKMSRPSLSVPARWCQDGASGRLGEVLRQGIGVTGDLRCEHRAHGQDEDDGEADERGGLRRKRRHVSVHTVV